MGTALLAVLTVLAGACQPGKTVSSPPASTSVETLVPSNGAIAAIYAAASPAVVEIIVTAQSGTGFFRRGFTQSGQGSGFLVNSSGDIVTNQHVVEGATSVQIVFSNGKAVSATVVGTDPADDIALIRVDATTVSGITPLVLADSSTLEPGQTAIAMGSPYGLTNSITTGVISGLNRSVPGGQTGMIQTDASIQPGSSGGPLLNSSGQVVGVDTAIEGQGTGIGFAIPSNIVTKVLPYLEANK